MSNSVIVGIDEAGRGPLAGPVVAAAVHLPYPVKAVKKGGWKTGSCRLFDSKQLSVAERESAYRWIIETCPYGVCAIGAEEVDKSGILESTNKAMQKAVQMLALSITPTYLLIDGRDAFWFDYPHSSIIKGDTLEPCIAAASIIAKVTRDRIMIEEHNKYPLYGFNSHKGYGAPLHIEAIKQHGLCEIHRKTYLRKILAEMNDKQ